MAEELVQKMDTIEARTKTVDSVLASAKRVLEELQIYNEFLAILNSAQNDSRKAFIQLKKWANDKQYPLSGEAKQAQVRIVFEYGSRTYERKALMIWPKDFDPSAHSLSELMSYYPRNEWDAKPGFIEYIWERGPFKKQEKMEFLISIIREDPSLNAVEFACRLFAEGAKIDSHPLDWDRYIDWWSKNKAAIE